MSGSDPQLQLPAPADHGRQRGWLKSPSSCQPTQWTQIEFPAEIFRYLRGGSAGGAPLPLPLCLLPSSSLSVLFQLKKKTCLQVGSVSYSCESLLPQYSQRRRTFPGAPFMAQLVPSAVASPLIVLEPPIAGSLPHLLHRYSALYWCR